MSAATWAIGGRAGDAAAAPRSFTAVDARTQRLVLALALPPRSRATLLDALGEPGAPGLRDGHVLAALPVAASLVPGGGRLVETVLGGRLHEALAALAGATPARLVDAWERARRLGARREAAAVLLVVALAPGWLMRRLEARIVDDLEAMLVDAPLVAPLGAPLREVRP
jgi:hypothetical protein